MRATDLYEDAPCAAPTTQSEVEVLQVMMMMMMMTMIMLMMIEDEEKRRKEEEGGGMELKEQKPNKAMWGKQGNTALRRACDSIHED